MKERHYQKPAITIVEMRQPKPLLGSNEKAAMAERNGYKKGEDY